MKRFWLLLTTLISAAGIVYAASAIPFVIEAVSKRLTPTIDLTTPHAFLALLLFAVPAIALILLRRRGKERRGRLVSAARYTAASSIISLLVVCLPLLVLSLLPAREAGGTSIIELTIPDEEEPNKSPQSNAGSRPSSDAPPASEAPSSFGPRG